MANLKATQKVMFEAINQTRDLETLVDTYLSFCRLYPEVDLDLEYDFYFFERLAIVAENASLKEIQLATKLFEEETKLHEDEEIFDYDIEIMYQAFEWMQKQK